VALAIAVVHREAQQYDLFDKNLMVAVVGRNPLVLGSSQLNMVREVARLNVVESRALAAVGYGHAEKPAEHIHQPDAVACSCDHTE
jgi:hypothetical protein